MLNQNQINTVLKAYRDEKLNATKMKNILSMISSNQTMSEVSIKRLSKLLDIELSIDYYAYRYDFVDFGNQVIYEFDGDQHFKFNPHFHKRYQSFIKQHHRDIVKQAIIKKLGFDLVRVSGNLTCKQFIDALVKSNRYSGQSLFIVNTELLEDSKYDSLVEENLKLHQQLKELTDQYPVIEVNDILNDDDSLMKFIHDESYQFKYIRYVSDETLYELYKKWHNQYMSGNRMSFSTFKKLIKKPMSSIGYCQAVDDENTNRRKRRDFSNKRFKTDDMYDYIMSITNLDNLRLKKPLRNIRLYYGIRI